MLEDYVFNVFIFIPKVLNEWIYFITCTLL